MMKLTLAILYRQFAILDAELQNPFNR